MLTWTTSPKKYVKQLLTTTYHEQVVKAQIEQLFEIQEAQQQATQQDDELLPKQF